MLKFSALFLVLLSVSYLFWWSARDLGEKNASTLQTIVYTFFFMLTLMSVGMFWAIHVDAIQENGSMVPFVKQTLEHIFNLHAAFTFYFVLWLIYFIPQFFTLLFTGILGYASRIKYLEISLDFLFWLIIKALITWSGGIITLYIFNLRYHWVALQAATGVLIFALIVLIFTLTVGVMRIEIKKWIENFIDNNEFLTKIMRGMQRNLKKEDVEIDYITLVLDTNKLLDKHNISLDKLIDSIKVLRNTK